MNVRSMDRTHWGEGTTNDVGDLSGGPRRGAKGMGGSPRRVDLRDHCRELGTEPDLTCGRYRATAMPGLPRPHATWPTANPTTTQVERIEQGGKRMGTAADFQDHQGVWWHQGSDGSWHVWDPAKGWTLSSAPPTPDPRTSAAASREATDFVTGLLMRDGDGNS